ncbi:uncharacterized protein LOC142342208 isoform X2 [Convolutriloba macropyga]
MEFTTLCEFIKSKENAVLFLQHHGIMHKERFCRFCGGPMKLSLAVREDRWRCRTKKCSRQIQIKTGSMLEGSKLSYEQFILFIYSWSKGNTTDPDTMFQELGFAIATKEAAYWNNQLREVCAQYFQVNQDAVDDKAAALDWAKAKPKKLKKLKQNDPKIRLDLHFSEFLWRRTHKDKDLFMQILHDMAEFNPLRS